MKDPVEILKNAVLLFATVLAGIVLIRAVNLATADSLPFSFGIPPLDKAMEAGYVQSGMSGYSNQFQGYMLNNYAKPYDLDKLAAPYFVFKRKQIPLSLGAGIKLKIQPDRATLSIPF